MTFSQQLREFFYSLSAKDKYSDFDSRKSFNRVNKPTVQTSLLYSQENSSNVSLSQPESDGVHETRLAWWHIKKWLHKHSQDINATLLSPCTDSDLNEFEKDLNIRLPKCVEEFFRMTDGQTTFNRNGSGGLVFGLKLMSIDEIAVMTESWRSVHEKILQNERLQSVISEPKSVYDSESPLLHTIKPRTESKTKFPDQRAIPPGSVLPVYAHAMWIPILTDGVGNCIAVDLSPSENSDLRVWGQVIIFGRDFDTKFKIADNFGDFLLLFANDLEMGNWELRSSSDDEDGDLMVGSDTQLLYVDHETKKETPYLDVLRIRATEKWLSTLNDEQKEENKELIEVLNKTYSMHVPEPAGTNMDSMINDNLNTIDAFNYPGKDLVATTGDNLEDDMN